MTTNNMTEKELWYLLIDGQQDDETGIFGVFYAYGDHLGDALDKTIRASVEYDFRNYNLIEASYLEGFDSIDDNDELIEIADNVYMRPTIYPFSLDEPDKAFIPPVGIVKSGFADENECEYDLIKETFVAFNANKNGFFEFELVLTKENLIETFIKTFDFLPTIDGFWIYLRNHWEIDLTELWVAKHFSDKQTVIDFLMRQKKNTLENGYLDIVVHSIKGKTNLALDDHKKIQLHTKDKEVFNDFIGNIIDLGYKQTRDFYNLEFGYPHFHYRPADSLTRTEFKQMLIDNNFELIDQWEE